MSGMARVIVGATIYLVALVERLAAHDVGSGGGGHQLLHLVWGRHHTIAVGGLILLAVAIGVGLVLGILGRSSRA